jgi:hypothetical protein
MPSYPRPTPGTYAPYFDQYIARVTETDPVALMEAQIPEFLGFVRAVPRAKLDTSYAPGKWTIKQIVGHLSDVERVMAYRALRFARGDQNIPLPGFDENAWVPPAEFGSRSIESLLDEWVAVRRASIALFASLPEAACDRGGAASERPLSVRALAYLIPGHVRHHMATIRDRYL